MTVSDRFTIFFTGVIAATGVIGSWIFGQQLAAMQGQLDEMKRSFATERAYVLPARFDGYGAVAIAPNLTTRILVQQLRAYPRNIEDASSIYL
jgi:hypothetical protein